MTDHRMLNLLISIRFRNQFRQFKISFLFKISEINGAQKRTSDTCDMLLFVLEIKSFV